MNKFPLVYIEWDDHKSSEAWHDHGEVDNQPVKCQSVGWEFKSDDKLVTITSCVNDQDQLSYQTILRACITKYQVLRKAKTKRVKNVAVADASSRSAG